MPCNDITEVIRFYFNAAEQLQNYTLNKRTCGADIGHASLLLPLVFSRPARELAVLQSESVGRHFPHIDRAEEFLYYKHWAAISMAAGVFIGELPGGAAAPCIATSLSYDDSGYYFEALIQAESLSAKIKGCGGCGDCGSH